jgi:hypothetical protein
MRVARRSAGTACLQVENLGEIFDHLCRKLAMRHSELHSKGMLMSFVFKMHAHPAT